MVTTHNLGFPRMGKRRELKFSLENYWKGNGTFAELQNTADSICAENLNTQSTLDFIPVGDFSFYDHVLDTSLLVGNLPSRTQQKTDKPFDAYFRTARGGIANDTFATFAGEMTKWFNTNYHYIVPEFTKDTAFNLHSDNLIALIHKAQKAHTNIKPVIVGPVSYLFLGKEKDASNKLDLLEKLLPVYAKLINELSHNNIAWVQIDEPALAMDLNPEWKQAFKTAYAFLHQAKTDKPKPKFLLATYFGELRDNLELCCNLPVDGIHVDALNAQSEVHTLIEKCDNTKIISLGVVNGRNIWKNDLTKTLDFLEPIYHTLQNRLWIAPSCSLLHSPIDLNSETKLDSEIKSWLSFAVQKIDEITVLKQALVSGRHSVSDILQDNTKIIQNKTHSNRIHDKSVLDACAAIKPSDTNRTSPFKNRIAKQLDLLNLPLYPTTTIGSFPQTAQIRQARKDLKSNTISLNDYNDFIKAQIKECIDIQDRLDIDIFVHGEAERNDMVEYFGEQLQGYVFSQNGWVQSYGSRMVKPPIIFGDVKRPVAMTVEWAKYAQSLTQKPVKGMLTGAVTMLNWSFVRDDIARSQVCTQLALAIRDEVLDLIKAGIKIIQIDEPALREGLPLRQSDWQEYLDWAVLSFKITTGRIADDIQIHTHMCYSEFNDIIQSIAALDADVITIETSRSDMELLDVFDKFDYTNDIGPGVYDVHSPSTPSLEAMTNLMEKATAKINPRRLWVNPDCGLKTRTWEQVMPALQNMVNVAKNLRQKYADKTHKQVS